MLQRVTRYRCRTVRDELPEEWEQCCLCIGEPCGSGTEHKTRLEVWRTRVRQVEDAQSVAKRGLKWSAHRKRWRDHRRLHLDRRPRREEREHSDRPTPPIKGCHYHGPPPDAADLAGIVSTTTCGWLPRY
ncbi:hypothetical protein MASR1M101_26080 [Gemmatimonas sp.]